MQAKSFQDDLGQTVCVQCRGDWYSCDCSSVLDHGDIHEPFVAPSPYSGVFYNGSPLTDEDFDQYGRLIR